ncbi:MAG: xanthine dehydrogenase family protein molybdopterin-binding subunit [Acidobacteria bacterium]|nr:xanthine dehydrogenase family protein molybdopterin-binding subunit [Acidobacteriota bacterium]
MRMTADAAAGLARAGFSRRAFLRGSGALVVGFTLGDVAGPLGSTSLAGAQTPPDRRTQLDSWIAIAADGTVTAYTGKCELGQGLYTAQMQLVAEELSVPLARVRLVQCDTGVTPDEGTTSGAQSHPANFRNENLALAGATAREALVRLASARLGVPADQLVASDGRVAMRTDRSRSVGYGELVGGKRFDLPLDPEAKRKPHGEWTVLGTPVARVDIPSLVTARVQYVHNMRVPGMVHGAVVRPPTIGAALAGVDESSVSGMPGFIKVVTRKNFVGVVAQKPWQALQIAAKLKTTWTPGPALPDQRRYYDYLRTRPTQDTIWVDSGDVDAKLAGAATVLKSTYYHPYQMHASLGSSCAVADVQGRTTTVWAATQNVYGLRGNLARVLDVTPGDVHVVFTRGSGCYGINGVDAVSFDAALLSQAVGKPVRVQLTRRDEMAWENYGVPFVIDQRVGLDAQGTIIAWDYESWTATRGGRIGNANTGNIVTGVLLGYQPPAFAPSAAKPTDQPFNDSNHAPAYVTGCVGGMCDGKGTIAGERAIARRTESEFFTGPLRAPNQLQNTFAHESFMDEIAAHAKADPVAYRLRHLREQRLIDVVAAAAKAARWEPRPAPRAGNRRTGIASGRGFASVAMEAGIYTNGWIAMAVDVEVNQDTGVVIVKRLFMAHDSGPISNPNGLRNQLEGAALQGMSRALSEEVTWDAQKITSVDWRSYPIPSLGTEMPVIETVLIDRPGENATGAGETASAPIGAAIGNAIFDATGVRLRQIPFTPARVKEALAARRT